MPDRTLKTEEEVRDFVRGCAFMGTGGGGSPVKGAELLLEDLREGREIKWIAPEKISDDAWTCSTYYMGSIAPSTPETVAYMKKLGLKSVVKRETVEALKELEKYQGVKIEAVVSVELGGVNTPAPIDAAVRLGIPVVDGDYAGRAIPELVQTTIYLFDKPTCPLSNCDQWGNIVLIKRTTNIQMSERIGKMISAAGFGLIGEAGLLMKGKDMKEALISGTLTQCLEIGKAIREARERRREMAEEIAKAVNGWILFKGKIKKKDWEDREGYLFGANTIQGLEEFRGHTLKIWYKNENHISWIDGEAFVVSPDIMECVNLKTGEPITNTDIKEGDNVAVIGMKGRDIYRTPKGLSILGPKHFGFNLKYSPIEKRIGLLKKRLK